MQEKKYLNNCNKLFGHCEWTSLAYVREGLSTQKIISLEVHLNENDGVM